MAVTLAVVLEIGALASLTGVTAARAAWSVGGDGSTSAKAGSLGAPTVTAAAPTCQALLQRSTLTWSAPTGASAYSVDVSTTGSFPGTSSSSTATSTTLSAKSPLLRTTYSVRVRATAGEWTGPWSATTTVTLGGCLA